MRNSYWAAFALLTLGCEPLQVGVGDAGPRAGGRDPQVDSEDPRLVVTQASGLSVSERGEQATFRVALSAPPTDVVTVPIESLNSREVVVDSKPLVFTKVNWAAPQDVRVQGVDDSIGDGTTASLIAIGPSASLDARFRGLNAVPVSVLNLDDDTAGIRVDSPLDPRVAESPLSANNTVRFSLKLNTQPSVDVEIPVQPSQPWVTVTPQVIHITPDEWATPQTIAVQGLENQTADGDRPVTIAFGAVVSGDPQYQGLVAKAVPLVVLDDDSPGFVVTQATPELVVSEAGGSATVSIALKSQPSSNVTIVLSSSNTAEMVVSPSSLTFTPANWNAPQVVTMKGVDDPLVDGAQPVSLIIEPAVSNDVAYSALDAPGVSLRNLDNDTPGVRISSSLLNLIEGGQAAIVSVSLNARPTSDVRMTVNSTDLSKVTVSPSELIFTPDNWASVHQVTVKSIDNALPTGTQHTFVSFGACASTDPQYAGVSPPKVPVEVTDDDVASVLVSTNSVKVNERGASATFTVRLGAKPKSNVTIPLSSSRTTEATVSPSHLTFTETNWNGLQTVTVTGVDDTIADGNQPFRVVLGTPTTTDSRYAKLVMPEVAGTNGDNDSAGFLVTPTAGLFTGESGATASFSVVLTGEPSSNVTVGLRSSNTLEGVPLVSSLTFTKLNWEAPQVVAVQGVNDAIADGDQPYRIEFDVTTSDPDYQGKKPADVSLVNRDNDIAGVSLAQSVAAIVLSESGTTATLSLSIRSQPKSPVTISLVSSNTGEVSVSPSSVTFTSTDWSSPKTVTLTGLDDARADGNQQVQIVTSNTSSADPAYNGLDVPDVSVVNNDNDSAGVTVSAMTGSPTEALGSGTFTVVLQSEPYANVTIPISSSNTAEATVSPGSLTFTSGNWNTPQTITVTGVNDFVADGNQTVNIITGAATSTDVGYSGLNPADVTTSNVDNDSAGFTISAVSGPTTEVGGTATFTVRLSSQPLANVSIGLSSSNTAEGTVSPSSLTFTSGNWNVNQTVTLTGVDDVVVDGNVGYTIVTAAATSTDPTYSGLNPSDVAATNNDNDPVAFFVLGAVSGATTESGGTATFTVRLSSAPAANVTRTITTQKKWEGRLSTVGAPTPADAVTLTFTAGNWNVDQTVTITGQHDFIADGNQTYNLVHSAAVSADSNWNGVTTADTSVTNNDVALTYTLLDRASGTANPPDDTARTGIDITPDGRYACFESNGTNLVGGDSNGRADVFRYDVQGNSTVRASLDNAGAQYSQAPYGCSISSDGRYVLFFDNVGGWQNVRDITGAATVTLALGSSAAASAFRSAGLSRDGQYAANALQGAPAGIADSNGRDDIYRIKVSDLSRTRVSVTAAGSQANGGDCLGATMGGNDFVVFPSYMNDLVGSDTNGVLDVFLKTVSTGAIERISVSSAGVEGNGASVSGSDGANFGPYVTPDGNFIVFDSSATNLVSGDTNGAADVFLRNRALGTTTRISVTSAGAQVAHKSYMPTVSDDGRFVFFGSFSDTLAGSDPNGNAVMDGFVRDTWAGTTTRICNGLPTPDVWAGSVLAKISGNGRHIACITTDALSGTDGNATANAYRISAP